MTRRQHILWSVGLLAVGPVLFGVALILYARGDQELADLIGILGFVLGLVCGVAAFVLLLLPLPRRRCLLMAGGAIGLFLLAVLLHNVIYGLFEVEEPVFFTLALVISPALFLGALIAAFLPRELAAEPPAFEAQPPRGPSQALWDSTRRFGPYVVGGLAMVGAAIALHQSGAPFWVGAILALVGWVVFGVALIWAVFSQLIRLPRRRCLEVAALALGLLIISALIHVLVYEIFDVNEPLFLTIAVAVSPPILLATAIAAALPRTEQSPEERAPGLRPWALPKSRAGKLAMTLLGAAVLAFLFFVGGFAAGQRGGDTFFSNLYLALTLLTAAAFAVLAGVAAFWAMFRDADRSLGALATVAFAVMVGAFAVVESLAEHDEPGSGPSQNGRPNSHQNLTVTGISATDVQVSFDYGYHHDPPEADITHLTVEALGRDGNAVPGYPVTRIPETGELERGDGHIDLTLTFTDEVLAQVGAFRVCFAGEDHPDFGCATTGFSR